MCGQVPSQDEGIGSDKFHKPLTAYTVLKRAIDFVGSSLCLILFSPVFILCAVAVRLDSPGPSIYRQDRVGRWGRVFTMYKFRTMRVGAPVLSTEEMQRTGSVPLTRVGPFLRKTSLDELPQLINIIKGDMSFVGPRPALPSQTLVNSLREAAGVDQFRPGLTGLAQVKGRDDLDDRTKVSYDAEYCRQSSIGLDLKILFGTLAAVFTSRGNK